MVDSVGALGGNSFHSVSGLSRVSREDELEKKLGNQNFNLEDNIFKPDFVASKAGVDGVKGADETGGALAEKQGGGLFNFDETSGALASGQLDWLEAQKQGGLNLVA